MSDESERYWYDERAWLAREAGLDPGGEVHQPIWCDRCGAYHGGDCAGEDDADPELG